MSLNRTLDRLFDEIRREAKRSPEFADRLDAVLRLHESRRDVAEEALEAAARAPVEADVGARASKAKRRPRADASWTAGVSPANASAAARRLPARTPAVQGAPTVNPAGLYKREGEEALSKALAASDLSALRALVVEHNLDPSGVTPAFTRDELAAHILAQARRRAERDDRMFDY